MTVCKVDDCDEWAVARGWCMKHYVRWRRHGDPLVVLYGGGRKPSNRKCEVPDCETKHYAHGLCVMHYARLYQNGIEPSLENLKKSELAQAEAIRARWGVS